MHGDLYAERGTLATQLDNATAAIARLTADIEAAAAANREARAAAGRFALIPCATSFVGLNQPCNYTYQACKRLVCASCCCVR